MNRTDVDHPEMDLSRIDRILASEEPLIPSSGFLGSVMESVRDEAAAPPPIAFPWKRAVPAVLLIAGVFGWAAFERSEEHTSELQSLRHLVCRLLLEKKK